MNEDYDVSLAYELINNILPNKIREIIYEVARSEKFMQKVVATVASYNSGTNTATVYFPTDSTNQSGNYKNRTGRILESGEKVYLLIEVANKSQGWIYD